MSFFSSTKDLPQPKQKPLGLDERRISTNEQARPVPYFCGIARLAVTFISEAFGVKSARRSRCAWARRRKRSATITSPASPL
jgi:hypothetical protein